MDIPKIEMPVGERAGVLIVDDTPAKLVALGAIVSGMALEIVTATSGEQALRQLLKRDFAVILLDVKMPTMDGFETATLIRSRPRSAYTPIIFVTAEANSEGERISGYTLGAVDFIYSPIIPEILRAKVQVFVNLFYLQRQVLLHNEHLESLVAQRTAALTEEITERKRAAELMRVSEEHLRTIIETNPECIKIVGADGRLIEINAAGLAMVEADSQDQMIRTPMLGLVLPEHREAFQALIKSVFQGNKGMLVFEIQGLKGTRRWLEAHAVPMTMRTGETVLLEITRDITERKKIEKMKSEFVSVVSHELRTPLTSIRGALGLVNGGVAGELPDKAKGLIQIAYNNSERLLTLINDLLDMEKITSGHMEYELKLHRLTALIEQSIEANAPYGKQYSVRFNFSTAAPQAMIQIDSARFGQVLSNLLSNAAKFSPPGGMVDIKVSSADGWITTAVSDQGPGIPAEFHSRIFQKFSQADSSDTRQKGGTGLGLSISKALVDNMGGRIWFDTGNGKSTTFYVAFQAELAEA